MKNVPIAIYESCTYEGDRKVRINCCKINLRPLTDMKFCTNKH